ncbi:hypothetical protein K438DRAFT_1768497 [Mycena galopus ATCC 62051]|nr:hypothetical protein K438DRAFT_1768497 [Mycena galopus ATCC 62051]
MSGEFVLCGRLAFHGWVKLCCSEMVIRCWDCRGMFTGNLKAGRSTRTAQLSFAEETFPDFSVIDYENIEIERGNVHRTSKGGGRTGVGARNCGTKAIEDGYYHSRSKQASVDPNEPRQQHPTARIGLDPLQYAVDESFCEQECEGDEYGGECGAPHVKTTHSGDSGRLVGEGRSKLVHLASRRRATNRGWLRTSTQTEGCDGHGCARGATGVGARGRGGERGATGVGARRICVHATGAGTRGVRRACVRGERACPTSVGATGMGAVGTSVGAGEGRGCTQLVWMRGEWGYTRGACEVRRACVRGEWGTRRVRRAGDGRECGRRAWWAGSGHTRAGTSVGAGRGPGCATGRAFGVRRGRATRGGARAGMRSKRVYRKALGWRG